MSTSHSDRNDQLVGRGETLSDRVLAARAGRGDQAAFAELYDRYASRIFNYCDRILGSSHDAADATQDTFIRLMQRLPTVQIQHETLGPYLFTVARNVCFDLIDKRKRVDLIDQIPESVDVVAVGGRTPNHPAGDPERTYLISEQRERVAAANRRLAPRHREVLALREVEDLPYDEIGAIMDLNPNGVAQLLFRARLRLRQELHGGVVRSFGPTGAGCGRAVALVTKRHDGELTDVADSLWLDRHIEQCGSCRLAGEELHEAGISYRALTPLVPLEVLRRTTVARAAELGPCGSEAVRSGIGPAAGPLGAGAAVFSACVLALMVFAQSTGLPPQVRVDHAAPMVMSRSTAVSTPRSAPRDISARPASPARIRVSASQESRATRPVPTSRATTPRNAPPESDVPQSSLGPEVRADVAERARVAAAVPPADAAAPLAASGSVEAVTATPEPVVVQPPEGSTEPSSSEDAAVPAPEDSTRGDDEQPETRSGSDAPVDQPLVSSGTP